MISLDNLSISYGGWTLFDGISFMINPKDRIGLVGKNGAGKTTLLRVITGEQQPTEGAVTINGECTIGYLPLFFDVAEMNFSRQTNKIRRAQQLLRTQISHTFSVSHNKRSTFLCTRNGKSIVHIALFTYEFYHFETYNATKTFWHTEEVCQKTNNLMFGLYCFLLGEGQPIF